MHIRKIGIIASFLAVSFLPRVSFGQSADSLVQIVQYIWVEEKDRSDFEKNILVDRAGLAERMVTKGLIVSWHLFRGKKRGRS